MDITITEDKKVEIDTKHQLTEAIQLFDQKEGNIEENVLSHPPTHLHITKEDGKKVWTKQSEIFH